MHALQGMAAFVLLLHLVVLKQDKHDKFLPNITAQTTRQSG